MEISSMPSLQFKGRAAVETLHLSLPYRQLLADADCSQALIPALDDNLIIHGDNLLALKALLPSYGGKVKLVYIDPPYNTGNENWVYNDNVNDPRLQEWLGKEVGRDDLTRHDKWLCMMLPRLRLLHELLREDGAIFVSIDDNEVHRLRMLMDDVFGEENFVATVVWQKKYSPQNDAEFFSQTHDYILAYAKNVDNWSRNLMPRSQKQDRAYKNPDNDPRGQWKASDLTRAEYRERDYYPITTPSGKKVYPAKGRSWSRPPEEIERLRQDNRLWFGIDGDSIPSLKRFLSEVQDGLVPVTIWPYDEVGSTDDAKKILKKIFYGDVLLDTPKPVNLIRRILQIASDRESIVLDSFAGSGTTGHAVLAQNAADGGKRRFILVEQEAYAEDLTAARVRRVIEGVPETRDEQLGQGYGGSFSFFRLGEALDEARLLSGELPSYREMARYVYFTATGETLNENQIDEANQSLGESSRYHVYLIYRPDVAYLKATPLTLDWARSLPQPGLKPRLVIASYKLLDSEVMREFKIEFCQLPFGIYRFRA
jgi:adenine-specific DNA-methyltransferase